MPTEKQTAAATDVPEQRGLASSEQPVPHNGPVAQDEKEPSEATTDPPAADVEEPATPDPAAAKQAAREEKREQREAKRKERAAAAKAGADAVRTRIAQAVRVVTLVIAMILALAALLVALRQNVNEQNQLVRAITDLARVFDGPLNLQDGVFAFTGKHALVKEALLNWGIAALVYLLVGRLVSRFVSP